MFWFILWLVMTLVFLPVFFITVYYAIQLFMYFFPQYDERKKYKGQPKYRKDGSMSLRYWAGDNERLQGWADLFEPRNKNELGERKNAEWAAEEKAKAIAEILRKTNYESRQAIANSSVSRKDTAVQSRPDSAPTRAVNYPTFPEAPGHILSIKRLDSAMEYLRAEDGFKDIDETAKRYIKDLMAYDPRKWAGQLERKEQFQDSINKNLMQYIANTTKLIDNAYIYFDHPSTPTPSPEYLKAFEARVEEWRQFIASRTDQ